MILTDEGEGGVCAYVNETADPLESLSTQFVVDLDEAAACAALLQAHIETLGLACETSWPGPR
jgi:hypothetical protein